MRILPQAQRDAMFAIYGFCRQVDDIADARGPRDKRLAELAAWRTDIMALYGGAPTWPDLDLYCDRVASAVGRLSVNIFGLEHKSGRQLAHHLGRALQLTNILRDLDEDAAVGRLYLPQEALAEASIDVADPSVVLASPSLGRACTQV